MSDNRLLILNPRKVIQILTPILSVNELNKIEDVLRRNVKQLLRLAQVHLRFARHAVGPSSWRQRVSRGYYSVYNTSKALRLGIYGYYNQGPNDHKNIGDLPNDFPSVNQWKDTLIKFRGDRNLADYDHSVTENALELRSNDYLVRAKDFLNDGKIYLKKQGVIL